MSGKLLKRRHQQGESIVTGKKPSEEMLFISRRSNCLSVRSLNKYVSGVKRGVRGGVLCAHSEIEIKLAFARLAITLLT